MMTLFLSGDVMTGRGVDQILAHPAPPALDEPYVKDARTYVELAQRRSGEIPAPVDDRYLWGFAREVLGTMAPDARIVNLETSVTTSDRCWPEKGIHYRMSPENLGCLTEAGIDLCTLANNHVLDWGYDGLTETLHALNRKGFRTVGAGMSGAEAREPASISINRSARLLVFSRATPDSGVPADWAAAEDTPGIALLPDLSDETLHRLAADIEAVRQPSDVVVVSIHWGGNWGYAVPEQQRVFAHRLIDQAQVDLVHGHSSHHVKAIEVYRDRLILYGCGDLITDYEGISGNESFRGDLGLMYFPRLDPGTRRLAGLRMQPTQLRRMQLCRPSADDVAWLEETLDQQSRPFGTRVAKAPEDTLEIHQN